MNHISQWFAANEEPPPKDILPILEYLLSAGVYSYEAYEESNLALLSYSVAILRKEPQTASEFSKICVGDWFAILSPSEKQACSEEVWGELNDIREGWHTTYKRMKNKAEAIISCNELQQILEECKEKPIIGWGEGLEGNVEVLRQRVESGRLKCERLPDADENPTGSLQNHLNKLEKYTQKEQEAQQIPQMDDNQGLIQSLEAFQKFLKQQIQEQETEARSLEFDTGINERIALLHLLGILKRADLSNAIRKLVGKQSGKNEAGKGLFEETEPIIEEMEEWKAHFRSIVLEERGETEWANEYRRVVARKLLDMEL